MLGAAAATSGSVALYHIVGVTPEAPTEKVAFGGKKFGPSDSFEFGAKEVRETEAMLSKATLPEVDLVAIGCPHVSISQIKEVALLLSGKKVKSGVELWISASRMVGTYAEKMGYTGIIKASGGKILSEICMALPRGVVSWRRFRTVATNSASIAYYVSGQQNSSAHYGSTSRCIQAAIDGVWK